MRLIDADALKERIRRFLSIKSLDDLLPEEKAIVQHIDRMLPVDAVPVVRGRWETVEDWDGDEHYMCSECKAEYVMIDGTPSDNDYLFCPNCGARMDGKDGDGNG